MVFALQNGDIQGVKHDNQELTKSFPSDVYIRMRTAESPEQAKDKEKNRKEELVASQWGEGWEGTFQVGAQQGELGLRNSKASWDRNSKRPGFWGQELTQRPWRAAAY